MCFSFTDILTEENRSRIRSIKKFCGSCSSCNGEARGLALLYTMPVDGGRVNSRSLLVKFRSITQEDSGRGDMKQHGTRPSTFYRISNKINGNEQTNFSMLTNSLFR